MSRGQAVGRLCALAGQKEEAGRRGQWPEGEQGQSKASVRVRGKVKGEGPREGVDGGAGGTRMKSPQKWPGKTRPLSPPFLQVRSDVGCTAL